MSILNIVKTPFKYGKKSYKQGDSFIPEGSRNDKSIIEHFTTPVEKLESELTVKELRAQCRAAGLAIRGTKDELINRLKGVI